MKKIGFIIDSFSCGGGIERSLANISNALDKSFIQYVIEVYDRESFPEKKFTQWESNAVEIINLNFKRRNRLFSYLLLPFRSYKLMKLKKKINLDYSISFGYYSNDINCRSLFRKTYLTIHIFYKNTLMNNFRYRKYKKSDLVISVSKQIEKSLNKDFNIPSNKTKTIYNMFDISDIVSEVPTNLMDNSKFNIIMIGRLEEQKGYFHALEIIKRLKKYDKDRYQLNIFGEGHLESQLKKYCLEMNIENNVIFWGFKKEIYSYLKNGDLYLMTSMYEGFPMVNVEALACKVPVFSVDCNSGPRELLLDSSEKVYESQECDFGYIFPDFSNEKLNNQYDNIALEINKYDLLSQEMKQIKKEKAFKKAMQFDKEIIIKEWNSLLR